MMSLHHTMLSVSPPNLVKAFIPLSPPMFSCQGISWDPLVPLDYASCNTKKQLLPTKSLNSAMLFVQTANTHTHTPSLKSVHPTVNFLTASSNVFNLSHPYTGKKKPEWGERSKNNNHMIINEGYVKRLFQMLFQLKFGAQSFSKQVNLRWRQ